MGRNWLLLGSDPCSRLVKAWKGRLSLFKMHASGCNMPVLRGVNQVTEYEHVDYGWTSGSFR